MKNILLFGAGSQAGIVSDLIDKTGIGRVAMLYDPTLKTPTFTTSVKFTNSFDSLINLIGKGCFNYFHVCIGNEYGYPRFKISKFLENCGLAPISVISSNSIIERSAVIRQGALIMPGAIVQNYARVESFAVINTGAIIEHEVIIYEGVHVMSGAVVLGRARVNRYSSLGANSTVFPDVSIGKHVIIGAGSIVNRNVQDGNLMVGSPARMLKKTSIQCPVIYQ